MPSDLTAITPAPVALRPAEAAKALAISTRLLWSLTNAGQIPCVRLGRRILYPVGLLQQFLVAAAKAGKGPRP
jgi:excisionase family DNA binding protein